MVRIFWSNDNTVNQCQTKYTRRSSTLPTKMNYQFTRFLALRTVLDYDSVLPNASLVSLVNNKLIGTDVLLTYLLHPGTAVYAGYSDAYENVSFNPPAQSGVAAHAVFPMRTPGGRCS